MGKKDPAPEPALEVIEPVAWKAGDRVLYAPEPLLYGAMEVFRVRSDGLVECVSAFRALAWPRNKLEMFTAEELAPTPPATATEGGEE